MVLTASGRGDEEKDKYASVRVMTPEVLQDICKERSMWTLPHLNTQLYLNYKGFEGIAGLEDYVGVKTLHLGNNHIARIEGLDRMTELRSLHLEGNRICRIEGLETCLELKQLNLEGNAIARLEGLSSHCKLEQLNLAHNSIARIEDLAEIRHLVKLSNMDVSHNQIEDVEGVVEFWSGLPCEIRVLRYQANPGVRSIEHYRKRLINGMPQLSYLDDRPVFPVERRSSAAWAEGGTEAMHAAKREYVRERNRMQVTVDPERRELLTKMRKAAIERIDREHRERQEREEREAESRSRAVASDAGAAVESGDVDALEVYAQKWRTKVDLYGAESVRAKVAAGDVAAGDGAAFAPPDATGDAPRTGGDARADAPPRPGRGCEDSAHAGLGGGGFAPPPRGAVEAETGGASASSRRVAGSMRQCASDFRVRGSAPGAPADHQERQFSVLGDDTGVPALSRPRPAAGAAAGARGGGGGGGAAPEVMPQIWQGREEASLAEEMRCLDQNMASARIAREEASSRRSQQDELGALD